MGALEGASLTTYAGIARPTTVAAGETLGSAIAAAAAKRPTKVALRMWRGDALTEITVGDLVARARRGAELLARIGVEPGDRVALFSENRPEWMVGYLSIVEAGATAVPIDRQLKEPDVRWTLDASEARSIVASPGAVETLSPEFRRELHNRGVPALDIERELAPFAGAAETCAARPAMVDDDRDPRVASLIFTSGTTGRPKGVLLTHESLLADARSAGITMALEESDEELSILPLHHTYEFTAGHLIPFFAGATISYVEALRSDVILATIRRVRPTTIVAVPRLVELLHGGILRKVNESGALARAVFPRLIGLRRAARVVGLDLSRRLFKRVHEGFGGRLHTFICGAAPLAPETWRALEDLGFGVRQGYGLTEASPIISFQKRTDRRGDTVGLPLPGVEVRIVEPDLTGAGEVAVRGPNVMRGYFRDPTATELAVRNGWLHTGDIGRFDRDGHLILTGRAKELIVLPTGKKVSPAEVEERYGSVPGVQEFCVVGTRAPGGEAVSAAVVVDRGAFPQGMDEAALRKEIEDRLAARAAEARIPAHMQIRTSALVPEIPRTTTHKLKRHELRSRLERAAAPEASEDVASDSSSVAAAVLEVIRGSLDGRAAHVTLDASLQFDLGLDSLDRVDILSRLEHRFSMHFPADLSPLLFRVRDVVDAVERLSGDAAAPRRDDLSPGADDVPARRDAKAMLALRMFGLGARALYGLSVSGLEHVPAGPVIFCPNHETHLDFFFVACVLPAAIERDLVCFAKREMFDSFGWSTLVRLARAIPVDRHGDARPGMLKAAQALRAGRPLLIHPEGRRTMTGALGTFGTGSAQLALDTSVPLVPVKIRGAMAIYPGNRRLPRLLGRGLRRLKLSVHFGKPLSPTQIRGVDSRTAAKLLTERLRDEVAAL
jgi:long-chain acyl-CoA synthetase